MRRTKLAFTLVELLVVIAIIAILAAFLFPVFISAKAAVHQMGAGRTVKDAHTASTLYAADYDDTYPLAMYWSGNEMVTWFGSAPQVWEEFTPEGGLLHPYMKSKTPKDPTLLAQPYIGDWSGVGYNWGVIGSNMHLTGDYSQFPNCSGAARMTELEDPSNTIVFATSSYYAAEWLPEGNGQRYLFGFFDPPSYWNGVPNVDFRHMGTTTVDADKQEVRSTGRALVTRGDGSSRSVTQNEILEGQFWRSSSDD